MRPTEFKRTHLTGDRLNRDNFLLGAVSMLWPPPRTQNSGGDKKKAVPPLKLLSHNLGICRERKREERQNRKEYFKDNG